MCGRYALTSTPEDILNLTGVIDIDDFPPRYNIAPTQPILVVTSSDRAQPGSNQPDRRALLARWGFIPGWVKDIREFPLLINARSETAIDKASFRAAMRHRRVLIPASGFYEWRRPPKETGVKPQAYWIRPKQGGVIAFGGLLESYLSAEGSEIDTAAILTTKANATIRGIHDRMPVVIPPEEFSRWLDCWTQEPRQIADLLRPVEDDVFEAIPVSDLVNKVGNMGPDVQKPVLLADLPDDPGRARKPNSSQMSLF